MLQAATRKPSHLFFSDIDGTLLRGDSGIHPAVKDAAAKFRHAGGEIVLATGRAAVSTRPLVAELGLTLPAILLTGSLTFDFDNQMVVDCLPLPDTVWSRVEEVLNRFPSLAVMAYGLERIHLVRANAHLRRRGVKAEIPDLESRPDPEEKLGKLVFVSEDVELLKECGDAVFNRPEYHFAFASRHFAEVVAAGADKGSAALRLCDRLGIPRENTFAAGDAMTDYPLLQACRYGFATADAPDELRAVSRKVVPECTLGGMAEAFTAAALMLSCQKTTMT